MDSQPSLFPGTEPPVSKASLWGRRIKLVIFVVFCLELGLILVFIPWTGIWTDNSLVEELPKWRGLLNSGLVRGIVSGFGFVDIWIGMWQAIHYRERTPLE